MAKKTTPLDIVSTTIEVVVGAAVLWSVYFAYKAYRGGL